MLELVTLPPAFGMRNVSPFCLKTEMLLTALELPFTLSEEADPRKAPKGKLPFLRADSQTIADSELIVEYLDELTQGKVRAGLSARQHAQGLALTRLAEDHLYWMLVASRWLDKQWFPNVVEGFFHIAPGLIRPIVAGLARREVERTYHLHGLGRHSKSEQQGFARRDLQALEDALPDNQDFLFGSEPNVYDFTVAAIMAGIFDQQPPTWINELAAPHTRLRDYTERVQATVGVYGRAL